jgi:hypothetical protein
VAGSVAEQRYQQFKDQGFQTYFYVAETPTGKAADATYCKQVRSQYGLTMPVLYGNPQHLQPLGLTGTLADWNALIDEGGTLLYRKKGASQSYLTSQIEAQLAE